MDENELARFLDGGLSEEERASAVAHLSDSDRDAELLADAAYLLRELGTLKSAPSEEPPQARHPHTDDRDPGQNPRVVELRPPSTTRTRPGRVPARWMALAAVLAGVLLTPLALSRSGSRGPAGPGEYTALLANRAAGLPDRWTEQRPWTVRRGADDVTVEDALAARLGALDVDLDVAVTARQVEPTRLVALQIATLTENAGVSGIAFAARPYRSIASNPAGPREALRRHQQTGRESLAAFLNEDWFSLGAWAEAARIAAASRDAAFFRSRASRRAAGRVATLAPMDEQTRDAVQAIRAAGEGNDEPDWPVLVQATAQVLRHLGR